MLAMAVSMTSNLRVPDTFKTSYNNFNDYPKNLVLQSSYPATLKAYQSRLRNSAPALFVACERDVHVPYREFVDNGWEKGNLLSEAKLKDRLGDCSVLDPQTQQWVGAKITKKDPKCRFVFIWAGDSRDPLKITLNMLLRTLTYHQVMANYLDFISVFGSQSEPRDLRFSGFRENVSLSPALGPTNIEDLGRSGQQYQLCYNLKGVSSTMLANKKRWSIRQAAIHHQFDVVFGTTLWIITKGNRDLKDRIEDMTSPNGKAEDQSFGSPEQSFRSSLSVHLLLCNWSTEEWCWYIQWLEAEIEDETKLAVYGPRGPREAQLIYTTKHLQSVQHWEDKTNEAVMILEANTDVLTSIRKFYERLIEHSEFPVTQAYSEHVRTFARQVDEMIYDSKMQIARAKVLVRITENRKTMILQHLQSQATEKMERLTISMHEVGALSIREAVAMRVITVVTLIYLPATFVSTFFSTDVIKYQNQGGGNGTGSSTGPFDGSFSYVALMRWLEITLPLSFLTLGFGYLYFMYEERKRRHLTVLPFANDESKSTLGE